MVKNIIQSREALDQDAAGDNRCLVGSDMVNKPSARN